MVAGIAAVAVGAYFFAMHLMNPLSPGFGEGGIGGIVFGGVMILWGKRLHSQQKLKEASR